MSDLELICEICGSPAEFIEDYFGEEIMLCNKHKLKNNLPTRKHATSKRKMAKNV